MKNLLKLQLTRRQWFLCATIAIIGVSLYFWTHRLRPFPIDDGELASDLLITIDGEVPKPAAKIRRFPLLGVQCLPRNPKSFEKRLFTAFLVPRGTSDAALADVAPIMEGWSYLDPQHGMPGTEGRIMGVLVKYLADDPLFYYYGPLEFGNPGSGRGMYQPLPPGKHKYRLVVFSRLKERVGREMKTVDKRLMYSQDFEWEYDPSLDEKFRDPKTPVPTE